jgi:hypothetical protein
MLLIRTHNITLMANDTSTPNGVQVYCLDLVATM